MLVKSGVKTVEENHVIDVIKCEKIGGEPCVFEKDINLTTRNGGIHKLMIICEKSLMHSYSKSRCYALKSVRLQLKMTDH